MHRRNSNTIERDLIICESCGIPIIYFPGMSVEDLQGYREFFEDYESATLCEDCENLVSDITDEIVREALDEGY